MENLFLSVLHELCRNLLKRDFEKLNDEDRSKVLQILRFLDQNSDFDPDTKEILQLLRKFSTLSRRVKLDYLRFVENLENQEIHSECEKLLLENFDDNDLYEIILKT